MVLHQRPRPANGGHAQRSAGVYRPTELGGRPFLAHRQHLAGTFLKKTQQNGELSPGRSCPKRNACRVCWELPVLPQPYAGRRQVIAVSAHLPVAVEYVFVGNERFQPHGAARVQLLRGNADLRAETEHAAVGKARGGVDVDRRRSTSRVNFRAAARSRVTMHSLWWLE